MRLTYRMSRTLEYESCIKCMLYHKENASFNLASLILIYMPIPNVLSSPVLQGTPTLVEERQVKRIVRGLWRRQ